MRKKLTSIICSALSLIMIASFASCGKTNGTGESNGANLSASEVTYVNLDINPEIELTVDGNCKVITVYGVNDDGKVLLLNESLEGKTLDEAIEKITSLAVELGYLTEDNEVINTSVSSSNKEKVNEIVNRINAKVAAKADELGITVKTDREGAFSLVRKLETFKADNPDNQLIQALTVDKFKLALSASETGEVSLEVAVTLDEKELIDLITRERKELKEVATDAYKKAKAQASLVYGKVANDVLDGVYATFYLENLMKYPTTYWYGHSYQVYKTIERRFGALSEVVRYSEQAREYPLDEQTVAEVLEVLGLGVEQVDKIKNTDGNITLASIEAYVDVVIKNAAETVDVTKLKEDLKAVLNGIDKKLLTKVKDELKNYKPQIEQIVSSIESAINSLKTATAIIPESLKVELNAFVSDIETLIASVIEDLENGELTSERLKQYSESAGKKAEEVLNKIQNTLTDEEKAEIDRRVKSVEETLNSAKKEMEDSLTKAENEVKDKLQDLKDGRRSKK